MDTFKGCILYLIQSLLSQQDWQIWRKNEPHNLMSGRAQVGLVYTLAFIIIGTIILMNLLIALMTSSFERVKNNSIAQGAYHRAESAYDLSNRGRYMPPPLNMAGAPQKTENIFCKGRDAVIQPFFTCLRPINERYAN